MYYLQEYSSIIGDMVIISDGDRVSDVVFKNQRDYEKHIPEEYINEPNDAIKLMKKWLDLHFIGIEPDFDPPYKYDKFMF